MVNRSIEAATAASLPFLNHSLGPFELSRPKERIFPIRPNTPSIKPPTPFTRMFSKTLNKFSGKSNSASIKLPTASNMLTTKSSIQRKETNSVIALSTPVAKLLMLLAKSSISCGICATMPIMLPKPLDNTPERSLPMDDSVPPIPEESALPICLPKPSLNRGRSESKVPFKASIDATDPWTPEKPDISVQPLALFKAVLNPLVKWATSSEVRFKASPKACIFTRAVTVASPSS